jgi:hypothetical protein
MGQQIDLGKEFSLKNRCGGTTALGHLCPEDAPTGHEQRDLVHCYSH